MTMNARQREQALVSLGLIGIGAAYAWGAVGISAEAGYSGVGPNFLPWVVSLGLLACGALLLWQSRSGGWRDDETPSGAASGDWDALAWISAGILLNAASIERIGFVLSCALCFLFAVRGLRRSEGQDVAGMRRTGLDFATGAAIAAPAYWLFTKLLAINLPGLTKTGWI